MKLTCVGLLLVMWCDAPPPRQVTVAVCPVTAPWPADYQKRLNVARRKAADPDINAAIAEAISLRDQARACRAAGHERGAVAPVRPSGARPRPKTP